jgi:hypothetical protein
MVRYLNEVLLRRGDDALWDHLLDCMIRGLELESQVDTS